MAILPGKGYPVVTQFGESGLQGSLERSNQGGWMPHTHGVIPRTRLQPLADLRPQAIPPRKDRRAAAAAPTTPSLTGWACDHALKLKDNSNLPLYRNVSGSQGCTATGHPVCAAKRGRLVRSTQRQLSTIYHLPATYHISFAAQRLQFVLDAMVTMSAH